MKWTTTPLDQVASVFNGKTPAKDEQRTKGHPVLKIRDVSELGTFRGPFESFVDSELAEKHAQKKVCAGDTLILNAAHNADYVASKTFRASPASFGALATGEWLIVRPNSQVLDPSFANHWINTRHTRLQLRELVNGIHLYPKDVARLKIPLPPLPEQRRIAAILDQADTLRTQRRAALAQLDSLTQSLFLDMFGDPVTNPKGWPRRRFTDLLNSIDSGWSPVCQDRPTNEGEWGVLKLGAVTRCEFISSENKALLDGVEPDPRIEVRAGDLLFSRKNTYELVAACALVKSTIPRLMMSDLIFRFRLKPEINVEAVYLHQLLIYPSKRRQVQKLAAGSSSSMPNISKAKLLDLQIETPPLALQQTFATRVQAIEALKAQHRAALAEADALFASLQQRAFAGKL